MGPLNKAPPDAKRVNLEFLHAPNLNGPLTSR